MDLEGYIGRYSGETRLQRLLWIGATTSDDSLSAQAYSMAEQQMKQDGNIIRYKEIFGGGSIGSDSSTDSVRARYPNYSYDLNFVEATEVSNRSSRDLLSSRLSAAQSHLNKEAIRTAYLDLAKADIKRGDLTEAYHAALRAKDYCTNRTQTAQVSFLVLEVAIHCKNYSQVKDFCLKVRHTLLPDHNSAGASGMAGGSRSGTGGAHASGAVSAIAGSANANRTSMADKLLVASALERLAHQDYKEAANQLRLVVMGGNNASGASAGAGQHSSGAGSSHLHQSSSTAASSSGASTSSGAGFSLDWDTLIAAEDVATYAALLSLATATRNEIIDLSEHPDALELVPQLKQALFFFGRRANYNACLKIIEQERPTLELDLFLAPHINTLFRKIREMCILEYWIPYQIVSLDQMSKDLDMELPILQNTIANLISLGFLDNCRIDCRQKTLTRENNYHAMAGKHSDEEKNKLKQTNKLISGLSGQVLDDAYAMIIRLGCLEYDLIVTDPQTQKDHHHHGVPHRRRSGHSRHHHYSDPYGSGISYAPTPVGVGVGVVPSGAAYAAGAAAGDSSDEDIPMVDTGDQANPEDLY